MGRLEKGFQSVNRMLKEGCVVPEFFLQALLHAGNDSQTCRYVHYSMCIDCPGSVSVSGPLIRLLAISQCLLDLNLVFCQVLNPTVHTWQAIIFAHHIHGEHFQALALYHQMVAIGIQANRFIFSSVLRVCASLGDRVEGMFVHEHVIRCGFHNDLVVGSTLIDMYAKCRDVRSAHKVFDRLRNRNVVSWNALISGYVHNDKSHLALKLFQAMQVGVVVVPNKVTFLCALKACSETGDSKQGRIIHQQVIIKGFDMDVAIGNTLIDMYSKCDCITGAIVVLHNVPNRNVVSWSAIISGAARNADGPLVSQLYEQMLREGINPDRVILIGLLNACGHTKDVEHGSLVHDQILEKGFGGDLVVKGALIDMYAKCNKLNDARRVFDEAPNQTLMLWGLMITGYTQQGEGLAALELFGKMLESGMKPDKFLFSCLLKACGNLGVLEQGKALHGQMGEYQVESDMVIGNALIYMYSKCGDFMEAQRVFGKLPYRDGVLWGLTISTHPQQLDGQLAVQCFKDMQQCGMQPIDARQVEEFISKSKTYPFSFNMAHYTSVVEILGCAGDLEAARSVLQTMPCSPNAISWMSFLTGCKRYGDFVLGQHCLNQIVQLDPNKALG